MKFAILLAPGEALYLVLDQILLVLCEVLKQHNFVRTEKFLFRFRASCFGFRQIQVSSMVVDVVDEECHSVYSSNAVVSVTSAAWSVFLALTIIEFRVHIQMTELIIQELFQNTTSPT